MSKLEKKSALIHPVPIKVCAESYKANIIFSIFKLTYKSRASSA
jgi:hypothetical protein